ncbi:MAG: hypothetical protein ACK4SY_05430 [Pyrobaculum sp.]
MSRTSTTHLYLTAIAWVNSAQLSLLVARVKKITSHIDMLSWAVVTRKRWKPDGVSFSLSSRLFVTTSHV